MNFSAVILAGGESRRMGRDKAWIEHNGLSLIAAAVTKARDSGAVEVFVSGRPGIDYYSLGCPVLCDLEPGLGPLGGIERGLHACTTALLLVLAVDMPRITPDCLRSMLTQCDRLTGVVPRLKRGLEPLAAVYPRRCHEIARRFLAERNCAAREFAQACLREKALRALSFKNSEAELFANWNSPEDVPTL
jgi:molybdopterin-guanine dinucleotide biosynthesis protein A